MSKDPSVSVDDTQYNWWRKIICNGTYLQIEIAHSSDEHFHAKLAILVLDWSSNLVLFKFGNKTITDSGKSHIRE